MNSPSELFDDHRLQQRSEGNGNRKRQRVSSSSQEEEEATIRRFPCRARGLSTAHNINTACIEIPANAPHGLLVYCIHPECKASGRKFKYCEVCSMPVAQRNFSSRHGHGRVLDSTSQQLDKKARIRCAERTGSLPNTTTSSISCYHPTMSFQGAVAALQQKKSSSSSPSSTSNTTNTPQVVYQLGEQEKSWLSLLWRRPEFEDAPQMSIWMGQVLDQVTPREASAPDCKSRDDLLKLFAIAPRANDNQPDSP